MRVLFALLALAATVSAQGWTGPNFYIFGAEGTDHYKFLINNATVTDPSFNLIVGTTYKFIINQTMTTHPFGFSISNATAAFGQVPLEDFTSADKGAVTTSGNCTVGSVANSWINSDPTNPCVISFTPPTNATGQSVYYRCGNHPNMVGTLTAVAAAAATTAPPTTPAPSGNGTTAPPTTTPAPTGSSSSTGKGNGAAVLVPGAAVFLIAAINALFA